MKRRKPISLPEATAKLKAKYKPMKIPARIQIADGNVDLICETRIVSGALRIAAQITKGQFAHIPEIGAVEDGQRMEIHLTREGGELH